MDDLRLIKKHYGEAMMHLCRKLFATLLEEDGELFSILSSNFAFSKYLYEDIISQNKISDFKNYVYSFSKNNNIIVKTNQNPFELLSKVGYNLYECNNQKQILSFKKYYDKNEILCTFNDERLKTNYVFFAVKKDVDKIKRENYKFPKRDD